MLPLKEI